MWACKFLQCKSQLQPNSQQTADKFDVAHLAPALVGNWERGAASPQMEWMHSMCAKLSPGGGTKLSAIAADRILAVCRAGPVSAVWGWVVVVVFTCTVALSMAEITSSLPNAGGPYFWVRPSPPHTVHVTYHYPHIFQAVCPTNAEFPPKAPKGRACKGSFSNFEMQAAMRCFCNVLPRWQPGFCRARLLGCCV